MVSVASTIISNNTTGRVERWCKKEKSNVLIEIPRIIEMYTTYMGGVDQMNKNINEYRIGIRGKKWWWCLFTWLLDVSIHNAWQLAKLKGDEISHIEFRQSIAMSYYARFGTGPKTPGRKPSTRPADTRYDGLNHLVERVKDNKKRRCAGAECKSIIRTQCKKCDVGLCIDCFVRYHTK